eukprot:scaffold664_cov260-Pinguiococcus_pyrenoidosus.AAC.35
MRQAWCVRQHGQRCSRRASVQIAHTRDIRNRDDCEGLQAIVKSPLGLPRAVVIQHISMRNLWLSRSAAAMQSTRATQNTRTSGGCSVLTIAEVRTPLITSPKFRLHTHIRAHMNLREEQREREREREKRRRAQGRSVSRGVPAARGKQRPLTRPGWQSR